MNPWVFFIRISVRFNKLSRIGIFRKRIISEIDKSFLTDFYFLMHSRFIVADKINIVTINIRTFSVTELFFFNNLYLSVFFSTDLSLSFQQFRLEILLSQLIESSLPYFPVFQLEIAWQILNIQKGTLAEQERVGMQPLLTVSLRPQAGFQVGLWAVVIMNFIIEITLRQLIKMKFIRNIAKCVAVLGCAAYVPMRLIENKKEQNFSQETNSNFINNLVIDEDYLKANIKVNQSNSDEALVEQKQDIRNEDEEQKSQSQSLPAQFDKSVFSKQQVNHNQEQISKNYQSQSPSQKQKSDDKSEDGDKQNKQNQKPQSFTQSAQITKNQLSQQSNQLQTKQPNEQNVVAFSQNTVQKQQQQTLSIDKMLPNQIIVSANCPKNIVEYLQKCDYLTIKQANISQDLIIKNQKQSILKINLSQLRSQKKDQLKIIFNFLKPPHQITNLSEAKQYISNASKQNFTILTYIPPKQVYQQLINSRTTSKFDSFTSSRTVSIEDAEQQYLNYAYNSASNTNNFIIIRTPQVANYFKLDTFKIGEPFILHQVFRESGNQSNCKIEGKRYNLNAVKRQGKQIGQNWQQINKLTHFYINKLESEQQLYNKVRQMQMSGDKRKILLFYSQQPHQQFHSNAENILEQVARLQKDKILIIKTRNEQAIKKIFQVEPDNFATLRLIDVNTPQLPLFNSRPSLFFSRQKYRGGPFKVQQICDFIASEKWEQYYESKSKLTQLKTVTPAQLKNADNLLVLMEKQTCNGCKYLEQSLGELKKVCKIVKSGDRRSRGMLYRYRIEDPQGLSALRIRRYSVFNQDYSFAPPTTTPKIFLYSQGRPTDLKVQQSLAKLNSVHQTGQQGAHEAVMRDIIARIRRCMQQNHLDL